MFNIVQYLRDRRVDFEGPDHGGWVNVQCPFRRSAQTGSNPDKKYLGFNLPKDFLNCWRCGPHSVEDYIMAVERCEYHIACQRASEYNNDLAWVAAPPQKQAQGLSGSLDWPAGTLPIQDVHRRYLASRGFDPEQLEARYGLMGTVNAGDYAGRIMIPIFVGGIMCSYQGRTIVKGIEPRYKACHREKELIDHRELLYDMDNARDDTVMVVEGVTDAWRLGDGAVATFGTSLSKTSPQIMLLKGFRRAFVIFDAEPKAQAKGRWLADQLSALGLEAVNVRLKAGDPGGMTPDQAMELKERLLK